MDLGIAGQLGPHLGQERPDHSGQQRSLSGRHQPSSLSLDPPMALSWLRGRVVVDQISGPTARSKRWQALVLDPRLRTRAGQRVDSGLCRSCRG
jgi:hypothetical protein